MYLNRSVHLAVRGLVSAGAAEEAQAIAAAAEKTIALADSTKVRLRCRCGVLWGD